MADDRTPVGEREMLPLPCGHLIDAIPAGRREITCRCATRFEVWHMGSHYEVRRL